MQAEEEPNMLGPALMVLLNELHNRKGQSDLIRKTALRGALVACSCGCGRDWSWGWGCRRCCDRQGALLELGAGTFGPAISNMANARRSGLGGQADKGFTGNVIGPQDRQESPPPANQLR